MKQYGLMIAAFGGTLGVLLVAFVGLQVLAGSGAVASPEPSQVAVATPSPSPTLAATPTAAGTTTPAPTDAPTATPAPTRTPRPTRTPVGGNGKTVTVVVTGQQYVKADIPPNGKIVKLSGGAIRMETTRDLSDPLTVTFRLPSGSLPDGFEIGELDVDVCGSGNGDFWEAYGPAGSDPDEYEVLNPKDGTGCWHFRGAPGPDTKVLAIIHLQSTLRIERLVYTVTRG